jgi:hypothetical protein
VMLDTHNISYHIMKIKIKDDALTFARATMLVSINNVSLCTMKVG